MCPTDLKRCGSALVLLALIVPATAGAVATPVYDALRAARPDGRQLAASDLVLERDVYRFRFESGTFHFLAPVEGRTVGAVFLGRGSYILNPATEQERRHLAMLTAEEDFEVLRDDFESAVLLFVDDTFAELGRHGSVAEASPDPKATAAVEEHLRRQRKDYHLNFHIRLLEDLLNTPGLLSGIFMAFIDGKQHPPALAAVDFRGAQALAPFPLLGGEDTMLLVNHDKKGGLWYLSHRRAEIETGRETPYKPLADALHYEIDTEVEGNEDLAGTTVVHFLNDTPDLRVLPLNLLSELRIKSAAFRPEQAPEDAWTEIAFIQEDKDDDANPAVVFPEPLEYKSRYALKLEYAGEEVLDDAGDGNFRVLARTSWYPNLDVFGDMATFELTYRVPPANQVVSVGELVSEREEGGKAVSVWKSELPIRVAGFNYGRFERRHEVDETSGIQVRVYSNPGTPDLIREYNLYLQGGADFSLDKQPTVDTSGNTDRGGPAIGRVNTAKMAQSSLADALNAARVSATWFGPLPQQHVAITQQSQWGFGQSWPSLVFLPYVSFMHGGLRAQLGMTIERERLDEVGYHELAHQWWGHQIGWQSYRDVWLCEGFADFSAALVMQHVRGWEKYDDHWRLARKLITERSQGSSKPNYQLGPITQGQRLITFRGPIAYQAMVYGKGGFVVHMLRMLMREHQAEEPDARFMAMIRDFATTYGGKNPTTNDFKAVVERHIVPNLNATQDGKVDWFFDQWVHGTEIPRYPDDLKVEKLGGKSYRIHGEVSQQEVAADFMALVPVYLEFDQANYVWLGALPFRGTMTHTVDIPIELPRKPRRALVNAHYDVLSLPD